MNLAAVVAGACLLLAAGCSNGKPTVYDEGAGLGARTDVGRVDSTPPPSFAPLGPGGVSLAFTEPRDVSGVIETRVECSAAPFRVTIPEFDLKGYRAAFVVTVESYAGPKAYDDAQVTVTLATPDGERLAGEQRDARADVRSDVEGTATVNVVDKGKPVRATFQWYCG